MVLIESPEVTDWVPHVLKWFNFLTFENKNFLSQEQAGENTITITRYQWFQSIHLRPLINSRTI